MTAASTSRRSKCRGARSVPLVQLAWGRSGDKGDISNIGLIARRPEWLPLLWAQVTPERVKDWFAHMVKGRVDRHHLPGLQAAQAACERSLRRLGIECLDLYLLHWRGSVPFAETIAAFETLKAQGKALLYTTHYMEEAQRLCDRVAIMDAGKILALDTLGA